MLALQRQVDPPNSFFVIRFAPLTCSEGAINNFELWHET